MLVLDIDGSTGGSNRRAILIKIRLLAPFYVEWDTSRRCSPIEIPATINCPLNLNESIAPVAGHSSGKNQLDLTIRSPPAVYRLTLERLIPALHKVMMDIDCRRTPQFQVDEMDAALF